MTYPKFKIKPNSRLTLDEWKSAPKGKREIHNDCLWYNIYVKETLSDFWTLLYSACPYSAAIKIVDIYQEQYLYKPINRRIIREEIKRLNEAKIVPNQDDKDAEQ